MGIVQKVGALLRQAWCIHVADYREVLELTLVAGERAARYRCMYCGATLWRYSERPLTKTRI
jgi:hypothetical protein